MSTRKRQGGRPYGSYRSRDYDRRDPRGGRDRGRRDTNVQKKYEDWAYALDFLPYGYMDDPRPRHLRDPILQVIGEKYFSLLEVTMDREKARDFEFIPGMRCFIGKGEQNSIGRRFRRIGYDKLSMNARTELPRVIELLVNEQEERFLNFFNNSKPITNRMHQLELLPGIGKKTMWTILDARKAKPFESYEDFQERTRINQPELLIVKRILKELTDREGEKHLLFVRP